MTDIHSCSYFCLKADCIRAQRDELREEAAKMRRMWLDAVSDLHDQLDKSISLHNRIADLRDNGKRLREAANSAAAECRILRERVERAEQASRWESDLCGQALADNEALRVALLQEAANRIPLQQEAHELRAQVAALGQDAGRYRWLRSINRRECLTTTGPEAGVWCDAEDEDGNLILLTEADLDAAIDEAMKD